MDRRKFMIGLPLALSGCAAPSVWAPEDEVARSIYRSTGPKSLTLYTMKNVGSDSGAHSSLLIDASQRIMWDPAGTFKQTIMPERNDVLFGVSPRLEQFFVSYHARVTFYVVGQKVTVPAEVAEQALNLALVSGPVPQANCTRETSRLLRQLPGFESIRQTWFPNKLQEDFAKLPGVHTWSYRESDQDDKSVAAVQIAEAIKEGQ
ncbi:hypothetical protein ACJ5NV_17940 [Loktanella agnita]|uniref:hypothetical protein n=1 Tax=Loktanella agnita TaxID=287097 RepID=UPI00398923D7